LHEGLFTALIMLCAVTISCQDEVLVEDTSQALSPDSRLTSLLNLAAQQTGNCLAISYPVTVFAYNSSFQVQNTYTLTSNQELLSFLQGIGINEYYAISYPLHLTAGGVAMEADDNNGLETTLEIAFDACNIDIPGECDNPGVLTDDLILYMTFSNSTEDLAGGEVTVSNGAVFVEDRSGNAQCAISFNGSQQLQVTHNDANSLIQGNVFSISVWFRMQNVNPSDYEHLFRKGIQGQSGFNLSVYDGNTPLFGTPSAQVWDNNWNVDNALWEDTENWHHLAVTFDNSNTARLYRDGVLQNTELFSADIGTTALDYYIGQNFTGFLDDLRVYKKVLTATEVQTLFDLEGDCSTCVE
jgi:Concanavalin A-like lectin/glucanases superfamily